MDYEEQLVLSQNISEHLLALPEQKFEGIDRIMVEIAELLTLRFPPLLLMENRDALLLAVELKFEELKNAILRHRYECNYIAYLDQMDRLGTYNKLKALGVPTPASDLDNMPF
jgi:hypothetical protein